MSLPPVDPETLAHSANAVGHLKARVAASGGALSFAAFMHEALYANGYGYYAAGNRKFADGGDFTTAPERSPLFAAVIARQCAAVFDTIGKAAIVEFGAGSGVLASDLLSQLAAADSLPETYYIIEVSPDLQARQRALLEARVGHLPVRLEWVADPSSLQLDGIVIGNEVLDALPVERFKIDDNGLQAQCVTVVNDTLALDWRPASEALDRAVTALLRVLPHALPVGYQSEYCLALESFLDVAAGILRRGAIVLSDYGYGRRDYYAPDRTNGTLLCHYRHHAHADPLWLPGAQDITAWVDFSRVAEHLDHLQMRYLGFTTQAQFLLAGGLPAIIESYDDPFVVADGAKALLMPGEMGERFRFIGFARDCDITLTGFSGRDYGTQL